MCLICERVPIQRIGPPAFRCGTASLPSAWTVPSVLGFTSPLSAIEAAAPLRRSSAATGDARSGGTSTSRPTSGMPVDT